MGPSRTQNGFGPLGQNGPKKGAIWPAARSNRHHGQNWSKWLTRARLVEGQTGSFNAWVGRRRRRHLSKLPNRHLVPNPKFGSSQRTQWPFGAFRARRPNPQRIGDEHTNGWLGTLVPEWPKWAALRPGLLVLRTRNPGPKNWVPLVGHGHACAARSACDQNGSFGSLTGPKMGLGSRPRLRTSNWLLRANSQIMQPSAAGPYSQCSASGPTAAREAPTPFPNRASLFGPLRLAPPLLSLALGKWTLLRQSTTLEAS